MVLVTSQPEQSQAIYSLFLLAMKNFSTIATQYIYVLFFLHCCCCTMFVLVLVQAADPSSSEAPMHKAEQQALYSAVQAFVGSWWNGSDLYPDPCGWTPIQGVYCDLYNDFWYVSVINIGPLYDNSLRCTTNIAEFSHHLFNLKHLKVLSFFSCFLSPSQNPITISTSNWEKLANSLESLEFRSNPGLIGTVPNTFGYLRNLQSLVLLENGLGGNLPEEIGTLVNLRRLVLAGNQFSGKIPESFGGLSKLLILDASRNKLSGSLPFTFGSLTSLLKLDLSNNMLEGKLPREIGRLKNLTLLDLGSNKISGGLAQSLEELVSVKEMVISNNPMGGGLKSIEWQNLQSLEILDLSNTCLTGNIHKSMAEMKRLRFLGLNSNNLSGRVSPRLAALPCIGALYLYGNNFTGELEFSESFYRRMGRRFGAWNNPKLCYRAEVNSTGHVPYGVKSCKQETTISGNVISNAKFSEANWDHSIQFVASLGFSSCNLDGVLWPHR
ncbi:RNI-like superfamily protein [Prunus dulcis]|uniref:RNI-like superfamily protein n=1 Tax=Prunus dulcis TaxID=3755 RepID=A0A4Y1RJ20_PRUDU|nr:RNI-like superfamily protein [Prunus dulcis]